MVSLTFEHQERYNANRKPAYSELTSNLCRLYRVVHHHSGQKFKAKL